MLRLEKKLEKVSSDLQTASNREVATSMDHAQFVTSTEKELNSELEKMKETLLQVSTEANRNREEIGRLNFELTRRTSELQTLFEADQQKKEYVKLFNN